MNATHLSPRLEKVAQFVQQYASTPIRLADIGSDHAYLPCYLALKNVIEYAVAGEVVEGPFQAAKKEVTQQGLSNTISVRKGNGLAVVEREDAINTITICGMGGALIQTILEEGQAVLTKETTLILQPNVAEHLVREWLMAHHYEIIDETLIEDHHRLYEIIVAKPVQQPVFLSEKEQLFGKFNLQQKTALFCQKWRQEQANLTKIRENLLKATHIQPDKLQQIEQKIAWIAEFLGQEDEA
ncbi:MAG: class I SAM-dependent methyltransferase [Aerococcaceae bacterium]|nr:class I SAM-dependent methyltransferase [Aerococcaceae bacterium]